MFQVREQRADREARIYSFLKSDSAIAALLAAIHFEWTIKRAILKLSAKPTVALRNELTGVFGLKSYQKAWREHVPATPLTSVVSQWADIRVAFGLRNQVVHGTGGCNTRYATPRVRALLTAAAEIDKYVHDCGQDLFARLSTRRTK